MKIKYLNLSLLYLLLFIISACSKEEIEKSETSTETVSKISSGYVLYSYLGDKTTHLIDSLGVDVKTWSSSYASTGGYYLSKNKTLLRLAKTAEVSNGTFATGGPVAAYIEELDNNSKVIWSIKKATDDATFHHDFKEVDSNTIIALTWQLRTYNNSNYWNEVVLLINKTDNSILWKWSAMDDGGIYPETGDKADYLHFNSVDYKDGIVLVSSKLKNKLYLINKDTKAITASITAGGTLSGQHDASFLDNGNILVFNNNAFTSKSAVVEITRSDAVVWQYSSDFYSDHISGTQRLESGNTFICSGIEGRFIEVTSTGQKVWDFTPKTTSATAEIFKARKYLSY